MTRLRIVRKGLPPLLVDVDAAQSVGLTYMPAGDLSVIGRRERVEQTFSLFELERIEVVDAPAPVPSGVTPHWYDEGFHPTQVGAEEAAAHYHEGVAPVALAEPEVEPEPEPKRRAKVAKA